METTHIYSLRDPRTNLIRYVGKANDISQRYAAHLNRARKHQSHKKAWIESLKKEGLKPVMEVLDVVYIDEWQYWETYWISQMKAWGFNLVNHTSGGDGCTFGNQTSFKKGSVPPNKGTGNTKICVVCGSDFKSAVRHKKVSCSTKCASVVRSNSKNAGMFSEGNKPWNTNVKGYHLGSSKKVVQLSKEGEFIKDFDGCAQASVAMGCIPENIRRACVGKSKTAKGFKWKYKSDYEKKD